MGTNYVTTWCIRVIVLVSLASGVTSALGAECANAAGASMATLARGTQQGAVDQHNTSTSNRVSDDYIIGPSDTLSINVWKDSELSRIVTVRPDGKISLPLVGELEVSGLTASNVQRLITQRLTEYVSTPQVTVIVQDVKSQTFVMLGKIGKPGAYPLGKPITILEAIANAGGLQDFAKGGKIYVMRHRDGGTTETLHFDYRKVIKGKNLEQNVLLKNGDTIVVP